MRLPWIKRPVFLLTVAAACFAVAFWCVGLDTRWRSVCAIAFSPDGRSLAAGCYSGTFYNKNGHWCIAKICQNVSVFDPGTGKPLSVFDEVEYTGTAWGLPGTPLGPFLAFSPDTNLLAIGGWDGMGRLWEKTSGQLTGVMIPDAFHIKAVAFSADGRTLASSSRIDLTLWDTDTYDHTSWFDIDGVRSIAFSPDSELIAIGCDNFRAGQLRKRSGEIVTGRIPIDGDRVFAVCFAPDGRYLALGGTKTALLWDIKEDVARFEVDAPWTVSVAISPDGKTMATAGSYGVRLWSCATGERLGEIQTGVSVKSVAYSPSGSTIATGGSGGYLTLWDAGAHRKLWSASLGRVRLADIVAALSAIWGVALLFVAASSFRSSVGRRVERSFSDRITI